ncbi:response regulator transcription factor [Leptolyngbya sp. FACHB-261]|uniref:response regulator transcription factor n=1 Tax=Leptolyngbya sp. FACHB-261 TaxID=2692806 RepID=UPI001682E254|nr:response regulator transcription factor [Leptolyngbya sp. FACHB-261]MBD2101621.1 response regulator transcription factor [Leptolyngbya sp. FACHB-261]
MIRLLIVDDQTIFRQDLAKLLSLEADLEVTGQASDGRQAIELVPSLQPDVVLMDVRMPICDGVVATREIHQRYRWIRILVLTMFDDDEYIQQSLKAGALGYLLKDTPATQIATAIRSVYLGYSQLGPSIAPKVFAQLKTNDLLSEEEVKHLLSKRELEVLNLIGQGKNNQEIAQTLYLTEGTVRNYVTRIMSQLGLRDRVQAALWARQHLLGW